MSRVKGEEFREAFQALKNSVESDGTYQNYIRGQRLNRTELAREIGCNEKAPRGDNKGLTEAIDKWEKDLVDKGVIKVSNAGRDSARVAQEKKKVYQKSSEIKSLREKNAALKARVEQLEMMLDQYGLMEKFMEETGRWIHK